MKNIALVFTGVLAMLAVITFGIRERYLYQEGVASANHLSICQIHFFTELISKYQVENGEFPTKSQMLGMAKDDRTVAGGCAGKPIQTKESRIMDGYGNEILIENRGDSVVVCLKEAFSGGVYGDVPYGVILTRDGKQDQFYGCLENKQDSHNLDRYSNPQ